MFKINLGRSFRATSNLNNPHPEQNQDISFLQEPYHLKNKVIGFPIKTRIVQGNDNPKTARIVHNVS